MTAENKKVLLAYALIFFSFGILIGYYSSENFFYLFIALHILILFSQMNIRIRQSKYKHRHMNQKAKVEVNHRVEPFIPKYRVENAIGETLESIKSEVSSSTPQVEEDFTTQVTPKNHRKFPLPPDSNSL